MLEINKIDENQPQTAGKTNLEESVDQNADRTTDCNGNELTLSKEETDITTDITRKLSALQIVKPVCTVEGCQKPSRKFMIKCSKCNLRVHS